MVQWFIRSVTLTLVVKEVFFFPPGFVFSPLWRIAHLNSVLKKTKKQSHVTHTHPRADQLVFDQRYKLISLPAVSSRFSGCRRKRARNQHVRSWPLWARPGFLANSPVEKWSPAASMTYFMGMSQRCLLFEVPGISPRTTGDWGGWRNLLPHIKSMS